ncbi:hypothetical protein MC885_018371 [Smutsia gigantea]|nr:hypothetical protein MC885_018371 [Smutsia gigantea]
MRGGGEEIFRNCGGRRARKEGPTGLCQGAPSRFGNGAVQPRQSVAVSGAARGCGSASEVISCLDSLCSPASRRRSSRKGLDRARLRERPMSPVVTLRTGQSPWQLLTCQG